MKFGLFLNGGQFPGRSHDDVFDLLRAEARAGEELGFHDLWVTEHHFIPFGLNSSALSAAAFLLGRTERVRVGTAVVLAPQYHPVQVAEQAAVLDQLSGGRFDLGIGRGGYLRDFEVFGTPLERYDAEVEHTARTSLAAWRGKPLPNADGSVSPMSLTPVPRTRNGPPLFLATSSPGSIAFAAREGLPLLHYFATPAAARVKVREAYDAAARELGADPAVAEDVHALLCCVTSAPDEALREQLLANITHSYRTGEWPHVPQAAGRHGEGEARPEADRLAEMTLASALVGTPDEVAAQLGTFIAETGARRVTLLMEMAAEPALVHESVRLFAKEVMPGFAE